MTEKYSVTVKEDLSVACDLGKENLNVSDRRGKGSRKSVAVVLCVRVRNKRKPEDA